MKFIDYRAGGGRRHDSVSITICYSGDLEAFVRIGLTVHQPRRHHHHGWMGYDKKVGRAVAMDRWQRSPVCVALKHELEKLPELTDDYVLKMVRTMLIELPVMNWRKSEGEIPLVANEKDVVWRTTCFGPDGETALEVAAQCKDTLFHGNKRRGDARIVRLRPKPWITRMPNWLPGFAEHILPYGG